MPPSQILKKILAPKRSQVTSVNAQQRWKKERRLRFNGNACLVLGFLFPFPFLLLVRHLPIFLLLGLVTQERFTLFFLAVEGRTNGEAEVWKRKRRKEEPASFRSKNTKRKHKKPFILFIPATPTGSPGSPSHFLTFNRTRKFWLLHDSA